MANDPAVPGDDGPDEEPNNPFKGTPFEQIFSAPLLFRGILAELGPTPADDALWSFDYDGSFNAQAGPELSREELMTIEGEDLRASRVFS